MPSFKEGNQELLKMCWYFSKILPTKIIILENIKDILSWVRFQFVQIMFPKGRVGPQLEIYREGSLKIFCSKTNWQEGLLVVLRLP